MRELVSSFLSFLSVVFAFSLAPVPNNLPEEKKDETKKEKNFTMESNWGKVTHIGKVFNIKGHPDWEAIGEVRKDGCIQLLWTKLPSGEACPSVYRKVDDTLVGLWGYGDDVYIDEKGDLIGSTRTDIIRPVQ